MQGHDTCDTSGIFGRGGRREQCGSRGGGRVRERGGFGKLLVPGVEIVVELEFFFYVGKGLEKELADVGKRGGNAGRDAVLGESSEELAEDVVDIRGGEEITVEGSGYLGAEALGFAELQFLPGMEETEGRVIRVTRHAAAAAVGKGKLITDRHSGAWNIGFHLEPQKRN